MSSRLNGTLVSLFLIIVLNMYKKASCSLIVCKVNKNYNKKQTILNKY